MLYGAFLRGINVGKHNRVRMADLAQMCTDVGLPDVQTYLQSGNLYFESDLTADQVVSLLECACERGGLSKVSVVVRSLPELQALVAVSPFPPKPPPELLQMVAFLRDVPPPGWERLIQSQKPGVTLRACGPQEAFVEIVRGEPGKSPIPVDLDKRLNTPTTARFWNVVVDFIAKMQPE